VTSYNVAVGHDTSLHFTSLHFTSLHFEDGGSKVFLNVSILPQHYMTSQCS